MHAGELLGIPATNREVETDGIAIHRVRDAKIVEYWSVTDIVRVHHPKVEEELLKQVLLRFYWLRDLPEIRKRPSTSELIDWIAALQRGGIQPETIEKELPFLGVLLKRESDIESVLANRRFRRVS